MSSALKVVLCTLAGLLAPLVCLVYRRGWFATPDDLTSPHGFYEPAMARLYARFGTWVGDYVWHGLRNRAFGLAYALKPAVFKALASYEQLLGMRRHYGPLRVIGIAGIPGREYTLSLGIAHLIVGYRLRPVYDRCGVDWTLTHPNMDARPILSLRAGNKDD
jgi:hypothetical protein